RQGGVTPRDAVPASPRAPRGVRRSGGRHRALQELRGVDAGGARRFRAEGLRPRSQARAGGKGKLRAPQARPLPLGLRQAGRSADRRRRRTGLDLRSGAQAGYGAQAVEGPRLDPGSPARGRERRRVGDGAGRQLRSDDPAAFFQPGAQPEGRPGAVPLRAAEGRRRIGRPVNDLFGKKEPVAPLAEALRPRSIDEVVGQQHLLGPGKPLRLAFESGKPHSMILWGPPGSGKTTIARLMATAFNAEFIAISAVFSGVKEIREAV